MPQVPVPLTVGQVRPKSWEFNAVNRASAAKGLWTMPEGRRAIRRRTPARLRRPGRDLPILAA